MSLKVVTPGNSLLVVPLADAKHHVGIIDPTFTDDDAELTQFIAAAVSKVERDCNRTLSSTIYQLSLDSFGSGDILFPHPPLIDVISVEYTNSQDTLTPLIEDTDYTLHGLQDQWAPGYISPIDGWPSDLKDGDGVVEIAFDTGYTITPPKLVTAAKLLVKNFYDIRGDDNRVISQIPAAYEHLIWDYIRFSFGCT